MISNDLSKATDPDIRNSLAAMERAAEMARRIARQTNTALVIFENGKLARIAPDRLDELDKASQKPDQVS
jgi:hypothetical protein